MKILINLLYLLNKEPKTKPELMESGVFVSFHQIKCVLRMAKRAGLVVLDRKEDELIFYAITSLGRKVLDYYNQHKVKISRSRK